MAFVGLTGIIPLKFANKCSNAGLHIGKGGGEVRDLALVVCHLFLASGLTGISTLFFACGSDGLAILFTYAFPILVITCVNLSL